MEGSVLFPSISTLEDEPGGWRMGLPAPGTPKVTFHRRVFPSPSLGCLVPCNSDTWPCLPLPGYSASAHSELLGDRVGEVLWPGRASPSAPLLLAFSPGKEQAAGVWDTHGKPHLKLLVMF